MRPSNEEIIWALRCISTVGAKQFCESCPYCVKETVKGKEYVSCDIDKIGLDAADELELLTVCKREGSKRTGAAPLTSAQAETVLALAACNMSRAETARRMHRKHTTVDYHLDKINEATGLDPRNFYDLIELVRIVKEG